MSSPKAPAEKPPVKVYGPSTAPPPGVSSNLPPPAVHVAEVVVSKLSQPSAKPAPSAKKEDEEIPDRPVLGTAALIEDAKTWPWRPEQPKFMRVGLMLALVLGIAGLVQIVGVVIGIVIAVYLGDYFYRIIHNTLEGSDKLPDWPKLNEPVEDLIRPGVRMAVAFAVGHVVILFLYLTSDSHIGMPLVPREIGFMAAAFFFPIAALMIVFQERFGACAPWILLPAFMKTLPGSLAAFGLCVVAMAGGRLLLMIPWLGYFLASAFSLVVMVSLARLLGMLAAQHRKSLSELH